MDAPLKKILRSLTLELRHLLEGRYDEQGNHIAGDLERELNRLGIWRDRPPKPVSELPHLKEEEKQARQVIDAYISYRADAGIPQNDAVEEFIRESAYTWVNRLFGLRCMEARGIIDPVIFQEETYGGRSMVHHRFAQHHPDLCAGEDDGLYSTLFDEFQRRSEELPDLFNPASPAVKLRPSVVALKRCIGLLSGALPANGGVATEEVFTAPDTFGWAYQYWNLEEKDRVFEMVRTKKGAKIEGKDIIPATCIYTEDYMVKYLVQNSLGATWMIMYPESKLSVSWEYYVKDADRAPNEKKPISEVTFLDPACGSGHFLIEAFDLFYQMYSEEGKIRDPSAICSSILNNNLFGIDIDERAVQITKAVLWMKAAEKVFEITQSQLSGKALISFHDHIIATNIRLPKSKDQLEAFLMKHPDDAPLKPALLTVLEGLQNVHELGSLVQIEKPVEKELRALKEKLGGQTTFIGTLTGQTILRGGGRETDWLQWRRDLISRLKSHFQEEAQKASPAQAFFSHSAVKGLALFDLLARRYDLVATNPPYMGSKNMGPWLKSYVEAHYPEGKRDLYAAFILRNLELNNNNGRVAMVTQHTWLFLQSFSSLRLKLDPADERVNANKQKFKGILKQTSFEILSHLGEHAFNDAAAAGAFVALFILSNTTPTRKQRLTAFRLVGFNSPAEKAKNLISKEYKNVFNVFQISHIPNAAILYWLPSEIIEAIKSLEAITKIAEIRQGLATGDNNHFIRFIWEESSFQYPHTKPHIKGRYVLYSKGGGYCKWFGNNYYLLDWSPFARSVLSNQGNHLPSRNYYFLPSLTYTQMARGSMGTRWTIDAAFDVKGISIFPKNNIPLELISALLSNHISSFILRSLTQNLEFHKGYVELLPCPDLNLIYSLSKIGKICTEIKKSLVGQKLIEYSFKCNIVRPRLNYNSIAFLHTLEALIEKRLAIAFNFNNSVLREIFSETGTPAGWFPLITSYDSLPMLPEEISELLEDVVMFLNEQQRIKPTADEIVAIKQRLHSLYKAGPGAKEDFEDNESVILDDQEKTDYIGAYIPIPPETFLEELSQKMEIHPISIYWLLKEGIEKEGWRCLHEERRYTEDRFTVIILRLLGHRWPKQIEAGEPVTEWADTDGIIPITAGTGQPSLLDRVRERILAEFQGGNVHEIEREFEEIMGITLERWLSSEFFKHHISVFKKRPIAWQLASVPSGGRGRGSRAQPAFSCLVYYHKCDRDVLHKIRTQYVGDLISRYETELRTLEGRQELSGEQATRKVQLENWLTELREFGQKLDVVSRTGFFSELLKEVANKEPLDKWTSRDGKAPHPTTKEEFLLQEQRYDPDINDGVRVNIAPLQKAGLLTADVIAKKDLEKAISDRAEWRADERRWCREGKLPKPGWWDK